MTRGVWVLLQRHTDGKWVACRTFKDGEDDKAKAEFERSKRLQPQHYKLAYVEVEE